MINLNLNRTSYSFRSETQPKDALAKIVDLGSHGSALEEISNESKGTFLSENDKLSMGHVRQISEILLKEKYHLAKVIRIRTAFFSDGKEHLGLFAKKELQPGDFVCCFGGKVLKPGERAQEPKYVFDFPPPFAGWQIEGAKNLLGNQVNHSSRANIHPQTVLVQNLPLIFYRAAQKISEGEEIFLNYGSGYWKSFNLTPPPKSEARERAVSNILVAMGKAELLSIPFFKALLQTISPLCSALDELQSDLRKPAPGEASFIPERVLKICKPALTAPKKRFFIPEESDSIPTRIFVRSWFLYVQEANRLLREKEAPKPQEVSKKRKAPSSSSSSSSASSPKKPAIVKLTRKLTIRLAETAPFVDDALTLNAGALNWERVESLSQNRLFRGISSGAFKRTLEYSTFEKQLDTSVVLLQNAPKELATVESISYVLNALLEEGSWDNVCKLSSLPAFGRLPSNLAANTLAAAKQADSTEPLKELIQKLEQKLESRPRLPKKRSVDED